MLRSNLGWAAFALTAVSVLEVLEAQSTQPKPSVTPSVIPAPIQTEETPFVKGEVPQGILNPILKEAAALARVSHEQLVIVRAQSVIWGDGSLGCPEPGMMYTQALVNGYWVVIKAGDQMYDFRVGRAGSFILCPPGHGLPPSHRAEVER